ncbi:hypothetical protein PIB30_090663, partial [Stylosanthes scabra]|nr:hypothetical protein [Stylosanthes scabra]
IVANREKICRITGKFQETTAVNKPKTLAEFKEKAQGQMEIEELRQARKVEKSNNIKGNSKSKKPNTNNNNRETKKFFNQHPNMKHTHNSTLRRKTSSRRP